MNEWHHGYLGALLILAALVGMWLCSGWVWFVMYLVGGVILLDDIYQHIFDVRTPLKILFGYAYQMDWVKDVTRWFDGLFGRKY